MKNKNLELLNSLYQNTSMGISALSTVIPKTKDIKLKSELQSQLDNYHNQSEIIRKILFSQSTEPKDINPISKKAADAGIAVSTLANKSTGHIAEMMIQGTTMGVIDINKLLNQSQSLDNTVLKQAQDILAAEQQYIDKLKLYL